MTIDKTKYPWAEHMGPDDRIGETCTYDPMQYLPLFEEKYFDTGNDRIGMLRYFLYDPTKHGYPTERKYPLLFGLHGASGGFQDRVAIEWAGAACFASPEYQEKLGGMFIVCPLANETLDEDGNLQMSWPTPTGPANLDIYSEKQREMIEKVLVDEPHRRMRLGTDSIYSDSLRTLLKLVQSDYSAIDAEKTVLFGTSAGGYMAWRLLINHPKEYSFGCVMAGAYLPAECELEKIADAGTRVLVCHARYDELVHWPLFIEPNLELYEKLPNINTYFPKFARNGAKEIIDCPGKNGQQGQHCINNCISQNLIYDDGTLFDERFPEGMTGYISSILKK